MHLQQLESAMSDKIEYRKINVFTGHFGSGKTEVAVNYAFYLASLGLKTVIVDLDIVNPFFRTKDAEEALTKAGIKVIASQYANTNVDVPAVSPEVYSVFEDTESYVILDIGGDDLGAKAVARFKNEIEANDYQILFVVNYLRPFTDSQDKMKTMLSEIEESSHIKVTGIVNNTNLMELTTAEELIEGRTEIEDFSRESGLPILFECYMKENDVIEHKYPVLSLDKYIKIIWD